MKLIEIIHESNKILTPTDLFIHIDAIIDLAKDDVRNIALSKCLLFTDFDFVFSDSVKILKKQLQKKHLKSIKTLIKSKDIENILKWIVARLLNNMRNISTNSSYILYSAPIFQELNEGYQSEDELEKLVDLLDLEKFDKETIRTGLIKVWEDTRFDNNFFYDDFKDLCKKFDINAKKLLGSKVIDIKTKVELTQSGNFQLVLLF